MPLLVKKKVPAHYYTGNYCQLDSKNMRDYRIGVLSAFFIVVCALIVVRLFKLQVSDHEYYLGIASGQYEVYKNLYPGRGAIYFQDKSGRLVQTADDSQYFPAAMNKTRNLLYAVPKDVKDPEATLQALKIAFNLEGREGLYLNKKDSAPVSSLKSVGELAKEQETIDSWRLKLNKKDSVYAVLMHYVPNETIDALKKEGLAGIAWTKEITRYYPERDIASQLLGFVGKQAENGMLKGNYGLESCYDETLAGEPGFQYSETDNLGRWIAIAGRDFRRATDGSSIVLTIDKTVEYYACSALKKALVEYQADKGSLIAMDPSNGAIIALCNAPEFDPNNYNEAKDIGVFNNAALLGSYEPGSVFKAITLAAALDAGKVTPFTTYFDTGEVKIAGYTIKNSDLRAHGVATMTKVLEQSYNTGAVYAAKLVGLENFKRYVKGFGFGEATGIDACYENKGNIKSLDKKGEIYLDTASFGQGITVTAVQLLKAFGAIANDGKLVQPYLVDSIVDSNGKTIKKTEPKVVNQVISGQTSKLLGSMLVSVVKNGTGKRAGVPGYLVAGKTGTAQVPDLINGGYTDQTIHTFAGFAPFNKPRLVMVTRIDNPKVDRYAESTATPLFGQVAKFILDYYQVPTEVK